MKLGGIDFSKFKKKILDFIFPVECLCCGRDNVWLCEACLAKLKFNQNCFLNKSAFSFLDGAFVVFDYGDKLVKKLIKNYKYNFIRDIGLILGLSARDFLEKQSEISLKNALIVPVPLHKKREKWRGFNQAEIIASAIASPLGLSCEKKLLRIKNSRPQAKLDREKRKDNVKDSFFWEGENLEGAKIILIDDVATTGATLDECARALKISGAGKVYGLVVAHG